MDKYEHLAKLVEVVIGNCPRLDQGHRRRDVHTYSLANQDQVFDVIAFLNSHFRAEVPEILTDDVIRVWGDVISYDEPVKGFNSVSSFIVSENARSMPVESVAVLTMRLVMALYGITVEPAYKRDVWDEFFNTYKHLIVGV